MSEKTEVPSVVAAALLYGGETGGWAWEANEEGDDRRWSRTNTLVIRRLSDDTLWGINYEEGLTENQENEYPWKPYSGTRPETVTAVRVYAYKVTVTEYRRTP